MNKTALKKYDDYCNDAGFRASKPRRLVYEIMLKNDKPLTAYEILEKLGAYIKNPKPPTAYRALEFLTHHGFVHRIESLNAYIPCAENHHHDGSQFLICTNCERVDEMHLCSIPPAIQHKAKDMNFTPQSWNCEIKGLCANCAPSHPA